MSRRRKTPSKSLVSLCFSFLVCVFQCNCDDHCRFIRKDEEANDYSNIKGMFVFGSSLVDNGNNNFINDTKSKADYLPYGIDFPTGVTGRFTNGKNVIDFLCDQLNLPLIPPFLDPSSKGANIVHGVNHASGSAGILDDTGSIAGNVTSLNQQIRNFEEVTLPELEAQLGCRSTESLEKYMLILGIGGNDYMFNYFLRRILNPNVTVEAFTSNLTTSISRHLKKLYDLGGRKFVLTSINPIGNSPVIKAMMPNCMVCPQVQALNQAAELYNSRLKLLVDDIKRQLPDSNLVIINTYDIIKGLIKGSGFNGFTQTDSPCCEVPSSVQGGNGISCKRDGKVCADRKSYVYFDGLHPTEAVNFEIASKAYSSTLQTDVYPFNVQQLSQL